MVMTFVATASARTVRSKSMSKLLAEAYDISAHFNNGEDPDVLVVHGTEYVKTVQCKDCIHWSRFMAGLGTCDKLITDMGEDSYCCYGESDEIDRETEQEIEREIKALRKGEE